MNAAHANLIVDPPSDLFGLELILPEQFWKDAQQDDRCAPERRLMLAVLEDAIMTLRAHLSLRSSQSRRRVAETEAWIYSDSRAHTFAFATICDVLGFDIPAVRRAIRGWTSGQRRVPRHHRVPSGRSRHHVRVPRQSVA